MKKICTGKELQTKCLEGVRKLYSIVSDTLGPNGKTVLLQESKDGIILTKDGISAAKFVELEDPFENAACTIAKQSASATNISCGDGTSTSIILTYAILQNAIEMLNSAKDYITVTSLKKSIERAIQRSATYINDRTKIISSLEEIKNIALISSNGDDVISDLIVRAVDSVGVGGAISIEESHSFNTTLSLIDGFKFNSGYLSNQFVNDPRKGIVVYSNPLVLVSDISFTMVQDLMPVLELAARENAPLVVIGDIRDQALAALIVNAARGTMLTSGVECPDWGENRKAILDDLSLFLGGKYFRRDLGMNLQDIKLEDLGRAEKIEISKNSTIIVKGAGDKEKINERIEILKREVKEESDENLAKVIQNRVTRLSSGAAIVKVGGQTESETIEKLHRVQDALEAVRAAIDGGIVAGGGTTQLAVAKDLLSLTNSDTVSNVDKIGLQIVAKALEWPFHKLVQNAKQDMAKAEDMQKKFYDNDCKGGFDFANWKWVDDMFVAGIVDPSRVVSLSLVNAASAACALLMMSGAIVEVPDEKEKKCKC